MLSYSMAHNTVLLVVVKSILGKFYTRQSSESQEIAVIVERYEEI
jgi:hypothetical protein